LRCVTARLPHCDRHWPTCLVLKETSASRRSRVAACRCHRDEERARQRPFFRARSAEILLQQPERTLPPRSSVGPATVKPGLREAARERNAGEGEGRKPATANGPCPMRNQHRRGALCVSTRACPLPPCVTGRPIRGEGSVLRQNCNAAPRRVGRQSLSRIEIEELFRPTLCGSAWRFIRRHPARFSGRPSDCFPTRTTPHGLDGSSPRPSPCRVVDPKQRPGFDRGAIGMPEIVLASRPPPAGPEEKAVPGATTSRWRSRSARSHKEHKTGSVA